MTHPPPPPPSGEHSFTAEAEGAGPGDETKKQNAKKNAIEKITQMCADEHTSGDKSKVTVDESSCVEQEETT